MDFIEVAITLNPYHKYNEILIASLSEEGYDSFLEEEQNNTLKAYIVGENFEETTFKKVLNLIAPHSQLDYKINTIEKENWNKKWETNYNPIELDNFCRIRAPFHPKVKGFVHEIIIEPKMSFGTGHHITTQLMIQLMRNVNLERKSVLDLGSGTGILAILANKLLADKVDAIDIEEWAYENMIENFYRNDTKEVNAIQGDISSIREKYTYDVLLANINRNVHLKEIATYSEILKENGIMLLSGFVKEDELAILDLAKQHSFFKINSISKNEWLALSLIKRNKEK